MEINECLYRFVCCNHNKSCRLCKVINPHRPKSHFKRIGICIGCDKTTELNKNGLCKECGRDPHLKTFYAIHTPDWFNDLDAEILAMIDDMYVNP